MPSHRRERVPRRMALRRIEDPSRHARLNAAVAGPKPALDGQQPVLQAPEVVPQPSQSAPEAWQSASVVRNRALIEDLDPDLSPTEPIVISSMGIVPSPTGLVDPASAGPASPGPAGVGPFGTDLVGSVPGGRQPRGPGLGQPARVWGSRVRSAVRGLLVTPWFAASTGFVIAAGMWLYSPHASISFPSAIGTVQCPVHGCLTSGGKGSLTSSRPGQRLAIKHKGSGIEDQTAASRITAGLSFRFTVLWQGHDSYGAVISISGRRSLGSWRLAFRLPGTQIQNVFGAEWLQLESRDGGTASPFSGKAGRPPDQGGVSFRVFGTGRLSRPTGCRFDGAACTFKVTSARNQHWPGTGGQGGGGGGGQGGGY